MKTGSYLNLFCIVLTCVMFSTSCKSQYEALLNSNDVDAKYEAAFQYFNDAKYTKSAALFESLSVLTSGSERDDTVQYFWGLSNYRAKDYYVAETNFANFVESYPRSPFSSEARFLRLDCLYRQTLRYELDPTPTKVAINAIMEYITEYPSTTHMPQCNLMLDDLNLRLDTKAYEAARLYYKMEDYIASKVAFKNVLKDDSDNVYREQILYYIAMSSYKYAHLSVEQKQRERYLIFIDDYLNFVGEYPESVYRRELDAMYQRVQKVLGRFAGPDDGEGSALDEKYFKKERKALEKQEKKSAKKNETRQ